MYTTDDILEALPRIIRGPLNARVWVDGTGRVCIEVENGGAMIFEETEDDGDPIYRLTSGADEPEFEGGE